MSRERLEHNPIGIQEGYLYDIIETQRLRKIFLEQDSLILDNKTVLDADNVSDIFERDVIQTIEEDFVNAKQIYGDNSVKYIIAFRYLENKEEEEEARIYEYKDRKLTHISSIKNIHSSNTIVKNKYIVEDDMNGSVYIYDLSKLEHSSNSPLLVPRILKYDKLERIGKILLFENKIICMNKEGEAKIYDINTLKYLGEYTTNIDLINNPIVAIKQDEGNKHFYIVGLKYPGEIRFFDSFRNKTYIFIQGEIQEYIKSKVTDIFGSDRLFYHLGTNKLLVGRVHGNRYDIIDMKSHQSTTIILKNYSTRISIKFISKDMSLIIDRNNELSYLINLNTLEKKETKFEDIFPFLLDSQISDMKKKAEKFMKDYISSNISGIIARFI